MTGYVVERHGYTTAADMVAAVVNDMLQNGFTLVYQTFDGTTFNPASAVAPYQVTLEAGPTVDPLNTGATAQPWRVMFDVQGPQFALVYAGSPVQLDATGSRPVMSALVYNYKYVPGATTQVSDTTASAPMEEVLNGVLPKNANKTVAQTPYDIAGAIGDQVGSKFIKPVFFNANGIVNTSAYDQPGLIDNSGIYTAPKHYVSVNSVSAGLSAPPGDEGPPAAYLDETNKGFINRTRRVTYTTTTGTGSNTVTTTVDQGYAFPLAYRLVITPRGIWLGCWEDAATQETSANFNWFLIQRPVDRTTGQVLTTGKAPVFCVNSIGGLYWQFVVRENDVLRPGKRRVADSDTEDSETILNTANQVSLSEDGKYIVTFPSRLNTSRYRYPHELDMIGITSADVVSQFTDVPLTVYSEAQPRTYKALQANGTSNTGMRLLVLSQGGGIS